jgi:hypothetical protein
VYVTVRTRVFVATVFRTVGVVVTETRRTATSVCVATVVCTCVCTCVCTAVTVGPAAVTTVVGPATVLVDVQAVITAVAAASPATTSKIVCLMPCSMRSPAGGST